jgi:hypothetical protein
MKARPSVQATKALKEFDEFHVMRDDTVDAYFKCRYGSAGFTNGSEFKL